MVRMQNSEAYRHIIFAPRLAASRERKEMRPGTLVELGVMGVENTLIVDAGLASHEREANGSHSQPRLAIDRLRMKMRAPSW